MEPKLQELVNQIGTDVSGKWIAVDRIDQLADLIVRECMNNLYLNGYDDAMNQIKEHFGIK
jgi:hypothetical protein